MTPNHFHIVAVGNYNPWINLSIESILSQNHCNFSLTVIIDPCEESKKVPNGLYCNIRGYHNSAHRIKIIYNPERKYGVINRDTAIRDIDVSDESIIACIDLDDTLADSETLTKINSVYETYSPFLTYGGMVKILKPGTVKGMFDHSYDEEVTISDSRTCRENQGKYDVHHLLTFRKWLYMKIDPEDLKDENGVFFTTCTDRAIQYPMIEMAGTKNIHHTRFPTYIYNNDNPGNVWRLAGDKQRRNSEYIRGKKHYEELAEKAPIL